MRNDHLSYNGYFRKTSPNIDKLASQGIVFENAFSHASWTLPTGVSFFTSLYPFQHGIMNRYYASQDQVNLSSSVVSLPDVLARNGYVTAAFTGSFDYSHRLNSLMYRFNHTYYPDTELFGGLRYGTFEESVPSAIDWLRSNKGEKFMLFLQGFNMFLEC